VGFVTQKPASRKIWRSPSFIALRYTSGVAGDTIPRTRGWIRLALSTWAAARRSSIRPFVHDPI
jgi:hypothetical protein